MAAILLLSMARILPVAGRGRLDPAPHAGLTCVKAPMGLKANLPVQECGRKRSRPEPTMNPYVVFLLYMAAILGVVALMLLLNRVLGPKPVATETKLEPFECGATPVDTHNVKAVPIKYYAVAIIFILFDLETVFLFIWALGAQPVTGFMIFTLGIFVVLLVLILLYVYKARLLEAVRE
jgi:NADH-quinone oxidoreductase subunit A